MSSPDGKSGAVPGSDWEVRMQVTYEDHGTQVPTVSVSGGDEWLHTRTGRVFHPPRLDEKGTESLISFFYLVFYPWGFPAPKCSMQE